MLVDCILQEKKGEECGSTELGQVSQREKRMDVEICVWGKGVVRSGRSRCIYKAFKRGENKSMAEKTSPW